MTDALIAEAKLLGVKRLEALAYSPEWYEARGWKRIGKPRPNGAVKVEVLLELV